MDIKKLIGEATEYDKNLSLEASKKPWFQSDRYQFTVVMPNLNYHVTEDVTQDVTEDVTQDSLNNQIIKLIRKDGKISTEKMAISLGVSTRTIKRRIKEMDKVHFVGHGFSGHWEVIE